jgi:hypothetical protein
MQTSQSLINVPKGKKQITHNFMMPCFADCVIAKKLLLQRRMALLLDIMLVKAEPK